MEDIREWFIKKLEDSTFTVDVKTSPALTYYRYTYKISCGVNKNVPEDITFDLIKREKCSTF